MLVTERELTGTELRAYLDEFTIDQTEYSSSLDLLLGPFSALADYSFTPYFEAFSGFQVTFSAFFDKFLVWISSCIEELLVSIRLVNNFG